MLRLAAVAGPAAALAIVAGCRPKRPTTDLVGAGGGRPDPSMNPAGSVTPSASASSSPTPTPRSSSPAPSVAPRVLANRPTQSAAICYANTFDGLSAYARPGGLVLAGKVHYAHQAFKDVSAAGGTVLMYLNCIIANPYGRYAGLLHNASEFGPAVPHWPGMPKANEYGYLADFRVGGVLQAKLPGVLEKMVVENPHMGGFFADDLGSRSYFTGINWEGLPAATQQAYRDGAIALCKTFRRVADRYRLMLMVNGAWAGGVLNPHGGGYPDMSRHGNALADGGGIEHHIPDAFHLNYASSTQWAAQSPLTKGKAFNFAIARTDAIRDDWIKSGSVAFCATQNDYARVPAPYAPLHPTGLPTRVSR